MKTLLLSLAFPFVCVGSMLAQQVSPSLAELRANVYTTDQPYIDLKMEKGVNNIDISFDALTSDRGSCWIDLNYNDVYDEGEEITEFDEYIKGYETESNFVRIYGKILQSNLAICKLTRLTFSDQHPIRDLNIGVNPALTTMDFSVLPDLEFLVANQTTVAEVVDLSKAKNIKKIDISDSAWKGIKLPEGAKLDFLYCDNADLSELDLSPCASVGKLLADGNALTKLDVSKFSELTCLKASDNQLESIELSNNQRLRELYLAGNSLSTVDVSACKELIWLNLGANELSELNVKNCPNLEYLWIYDNQIKAPEMLAICSQLPDRNSTPEYNGCVWVVDTTNPNEANVCNVDAVKAAANLNWITMDFQNGWDIDRIPYEGADAASIHANETSEVCCSVLAGQLHVSMPENMTNKRMSIIAADGRVVWEGIAKGTQLQIALDDWNSGVYLLTIGKQFVKFAI